MPTQFTWIPFYRELTDRILDLTSDDLLDALVTMKGDGIPTMFLEENMLAGQPKRPLTVMDPYTFLMNFNVRRSSTALQGYQWLHQHWHLKAPVPTDIVGLPRFGAIQPWYFFATGDGGDPPAAVDLLWEFFGYAKSLVKPQIDRRLFGACYRLKGSGMTKLTAALYWTHPHLFLPLTASVMKFVEQERFVCNQKLLRAGDVPEYEALLGQVRVRYGDGRTRPDFPRIVAQALEDNEAARVQRRLASQSSR